MTRSVGTRRIPPAVGISLLIVGAAQVIPVQGGVAHAQPVDFTLKVTPSQGALTDEYVATVQITVRGVNGPDRFWAPDFGDFTIVDQRTQQSTQWIYDPVNGQEIRNNEVRRWVLRPQRSGKLPIGEAKMRLDGVDYQTRSVVVEVLDGPTTPNDPNNGQPQIPPPDPSIVGPTFLHAYVDRSKVYLGEQVTVTWLLYTRSEVLKFEPKPPRFDGLWAETLYEPQNYLTYSEDVVEGRTYAVAMVARRALFPTRAGKVVVPKYEADVSTMATPFGRPLKLASKEIVLDVEALPPGAPPGFDDAYVGKFAVDASLDRENVAAGESITLTLLVRGEGAVRRARAPKLELPGFQVYPPRNFDEKIDVSTGVVRGERKYTYILTPTRGGSHGVGPIEVAYFDPSNGKYQVARTDVMRVKVVGDPSALPTGPSVDPQENVIGKDIRPARELGNVRTRLAADAYRLRLFWLLALAPGGAFLGIVVVDRMRERMRRETPRARLRRARGRARKRLRTAELHIKGGRAAKFFGEIARALNEHIEESTGTPVAAMTRDQLGEFLTAKGFPAETVEALVRELENCDFARFAPSASGPGEMRSAMRRVRALLTAIERVRPRGGDEATA